MGDLISILADAETVRLLRRFRRRGTGVVTGAVLLVALEGSDGLSGSFERVGVGVGVGVGVYLSISNGQSGLDGSGSGDDGVGVRALLSR
jgi:hypothetical protein